MYAISGEDGASSPWKLSKLSFFEKYLAFSKKAWRHFPSNRDVVGLGLPSDNNFQPITSFVSLVLP